ncbi:MAG TPA: acyl carrier protein [Kofleriaceae bacterium]
MSTANVKQLLASALGVPVARVGDDAARGKLRGWDSIGHVGVVAALEDHFAVKLDDADLLKMTSLPEIVAVLRAKGVALD